MKHAVVCSDHLNDADYIRNHKLQSGLLNLKVNKVMKRDTAPSNFVFNSTVSTANQARARGQEQGESSIQLCEIVIHTHTRLPCSMQL